MIIRYFSLLTFTLALTACTADGEPAQDYDEVKVSDVANEPDEDANELFLETTPWSEVTAGSTTEETDRYDAINTDTLVYDKRGPTNWFSTGKRVNPTGDGYTVKSNPLGQNKGYRGIYEDEEVSTRADITDVRYKQ